MNNLADKERTENKETRDKKQTITNSTNQSNLKQEKKYDLEDRTAQFAKIIIRMCKEIERNLITNRIIDQLIRASGAIGANYREANDALGKKDFIMRMKISRKEAKEAHYWLELLKEADPLKDEQIRLLLKEARELINILSSIIIKSENKMSKNILLEIE